jgi:hypothetical protein
VIVQDRSQRATRTGFNSIPGAKSPHERDEDLRRAHFTAVMGASNFTYVEATDAWVGERAASGPPTSARWSRHLQKATRTVPVVFARPSTRLIAPALPGAFSHSITSSLVSSWLVSSWLVRSLAAKLCPMSQTL